MTDTIKAFLEADAKRTQGEWDSFYAEVGAHKENLLNNNNFIVLASTLAPAIRTMLADIEIAREVLDKLPKLDYIATQQALSALDKYKGGV